MINALKKLLSIMISRLFLVLVIIFLLSFIVFWLIIPLFFQIGIKWQLIGSTIGAIIFSTIVGLYHFCVILIEKKVEERLTKRSTGKDTAVSYSSEATRRIAFRKYLFYKLNIKNGIPLLIQRLFHQSKVYLYFGASEELLDYLNLSKWTELDNPEGFPIKIWTNNKTILINLIDPEDSLIHYALSLLSRYSFIIPLTGFFTTVDASRLLRTTESATFVKEQQAWTETLRKYASFKEVKPVVLLNKLQKLNGADDACLISDVKNEFSKQLKPGFFQKPLLFIQNIEFQILRHMSMNASNLLNSKLFLFFLELNKVNKVLERLRTELKLESVKFYLDSPEMNEHDLLLNLRNKNFFHNSSRQKVWSELLKYLTVVYGVILVVLLVSSYTINRDRIHDVEDLLKKIQRLERKSNGHVELDNDLYKIELYNKDKKNVLQNFGFSHGQKVDAILDDIWKSEIKSQIFPVLKTQLEALLNTAVNKNENVHLALSSYLMLANPKHYDPEVIFYWLENNRDILICNSLTNQNFYSLLEKIKSSGFSPVSYNEDLVKKATKLLPPLETQIKKQLAKISQEAGEFDLTSLLLPADTLLLKDNQSLTVSRFYTKEGFKQNIESGFENLVESLHKENWVYSSSLKDERTKKLVLALYSEAYIAEWDTVIEKVKIYPTDNVYLAANLLKESSKVQGFLRRLAECVVENTHLNDKEDYHGLKGENITKHFLRWYALVKSPGGIKTLEMISSQLSQINQYLEGLLEGENHSKKFYEEFKNVDESGVGIKVLGALDVHSSKLPEGFAKWITDIRSNVVLAMLYQAKDHLSAVWQYKVLKSTSELLTKYPFNRNSDSEITLSQFTGLFGPQGTLKNFLEQYIAVFIDLNTGIQKNIYGVTMPFKTEAKQSFQIISEINKEFFGGENDSLKVMFTLTPINLSNSIGTAEIVLLDNKLIYQHGPELNYSYLWPSKILNAESSLTLHDGEKRVYQYHAKGTWSWLKLIQKSEISSTAEEKCWVLNFNENNHSFELKLNALTDMDLILSDVLSNFYLATNL